ncbi:MAG TPA: TonB-dependent receptor [Cytophagales bacterium]
MRLILLLLLTGLGLGRALSQSPGGGTITGTVVDSTSRQPLREATVSLLSARDSAFVTFTITGGEGQFRFRGVPEGRYRLLVTYVGYHNGQRTVAVSPAAPHADAGRLALVPATVALGEVVVVQEKAPVALKGDTVEFNAGSFKTRPDAQVEDLLKKLPGLEVARDGTLKAQGEEVKRVLVDGKPFFGDDPKVATRNLPAELVDKIQLFDQSSDQAAFSGFDDGSREKTINITTKKDKRKGVFGLNGAGAGTDGRYQARLGLNRFREEQQFSLLGMANNLNQQGFTIQDLLGFGGGNPAPAGSNAGGGPGSVVAGAPGRGDNPAPAGPPGSPADNLTETGAGGVNFRDDWGKKAEFTGSYFFNHAGVSTRQSTFRRNILPDTSFTQAQQFESRQAGNSHRLHFRLDYRLDSLTTLRVTPALTVQAADFGSGTHARSFAPGEAPLNGSTSRVHQEGQAGQGTHNLLLTRKFRKRGRTFSVNLNTRLNTQRTEGVNRSENQFFGPGGDSLAGTHLDQQQHQRTRSLTHAATAAYTEPLSLRRSVQVGYAYGTTGSSASRTVADYREATGAYDLYNERLSNRLDNSFNYHRPGVAVQTRRLKYTYAVGLDLQTAALRTDNRTDGSSLTRRFTHLLPNALFTCNLGRNRSLRVNYRSRIDPPSVTQLQPAADYSNPLSIRAGNPALKPEYSHTGLALYNYFDPASFRSVTGMLNVSGTGSKIVNATDISPTGVQTTRPVNAGGAYAASGFLAVGQPVRALRSNLNLTTRLDYSRSVSRVNALPNYARSLTLGQGLSLHTNFSQQLEWSLSGNLNYQHAAYSLQSGQNSRFFYGTLTLDGYCQLPFRLVLATDVTYTGSAGRSAGYNQRFTLWNVSLGRQFFRGKQGELKVQVYDLLNQNRSLVRNVGDTYLEDVQSQVLNRYVLLSFTYHLRRFGGPAPGR